MADFPRKRVAHEGEWRDAWCVPAGANRILDFGPLPANAVLRLGIFGNEPGHAEIPVRVYLGDRLAARFNATGNLQWSDHRIDLSTHATRGGPCRVVFDTQRSFHLAPCEVISTGASGPTVLIFLVDSLRLDHLGCYGYGRDTSPNIDALAQDAVTFTQLMPQSSWTRPSVASLLTGTYPNVHGAHDELDALRKNLPTLADALEAAGYETHGFMTNVNCLPLWGFGAEFSRYVDVDSAQWETCDDANVADAAIATLRSAAGRPWFLYIHTMGPHCPYAPPEPYDKRFQPQGYEGTETEIKRKKAIDLYDGEIAYTDVQFGRLMRELKSLGLYDNTLVILLSDHGEEFWEHGLFGHGLTLYEEVLRIPLLIKLPSSAHAGQVRAELVESVDIAPTILDVLGVPPNPRFQRRSLIDLIRTGQAEERIGYASLHLKKRSMRTAKTVRAKYVHDLAASNKLWFDLANDPDELTPRREGPPCGDPLAQHITRRAIEGAAGFHLLVTEGPDANHKITGTAKAEGADSFEVSYCDLTSDVTKNGNSVEFRMETRDEAGAGAPVGIWQEAFVEHRHARLHIEVKPAISLVVDLQVDGKSPAESNVFVGRDKVHRRLDGAVLNPWEIAAAPDAFDPPALPERFAIYLWYVPPAEVLTEEELGPEVKDALRALGYLD